MKYGNRLKFVNWRIDADGFLRVTARVLKEGVFPYAISELPEEIQKNLSPTLKAFPEYIPAAEFTAESLATLEGKPVIVSEHEWRDAGNTQEDGLTVGSIAGTPRMVDGAIECDFLITHAETIQAITSKELIEVSAGYDGDLEVEDGIFGETPYKAKQTNLRFNHVLLLPQGDGRCGHDVRIINKKETEMAEKTHSVTVRIGNSERKFQFTNEADLAEAQRMVEETSEPLRVQLENATKRANEAEEERDKEKGEKEKAQKDGEEKDKEIANLKAKNEDPEELEKKAKELLEQAEEEEAAMDEEDDKSKEEVKNKCKNKNSLDRIKIIMGHISNKRGLSIEGLSDEAVRAQFKFHAANCKAAITARGKNTVPGAQHFNNSEPQSGASRFLAGRFGNKGEK